MQNKKCLPLKVGEHVFKSLRSVVGIFFFFLFQLGAIQRFKSVGEQRKFQLQVGSTPAPSSGLTASWQEPGYQA